MLALETLVTDEWKGVRKEEVALEFLLTAECVPCICALRKERT